MEEVAAALATMTSKGVPTAQSTTQLRALFVETNKESRKLAQAIVELTGKSFRDLMTEGRSAAGVLQELRESVGEKEFSQLFRSVESMNAALLMTGPNAEKMTENLAEMAEAAGATETAFQVVADTTKFKLGQAWNELKVTLMDLGMKALPFIVDALDILKVVVADVSRVVKSDILPALRDFWAVLKGSGLLTFVITQFKNWWTQMKVTWGILKDFLRFVKAVFKGDWKAAWNAMKDIFRGFVNMVIVGANKMINAVNLVSGIISGIAGLAGQEIDLTVSSISLWTDANDDLSASALSLKDSWGRLNPVVVAVEEVLDDAAASVLDATDATDDLSAAAAQGANKLGKLSAQVIATTIATRIYRAEVSGSAQDMIDATLGQMHMFEKLHNAIKESKRITEIATSLMTGQWGEVETAVRHGGNAARDTGEDFGDLADGLGGVDDGLGLVGDGLDDVVEGLEELTRIADTAFRSLTQFDFMMTALTRAEDVASEVTRRFAIQDIGLLIQQLDGPMQKSWNNLFATMLMNSAGADELQEFLGYLEIAISALPEVLEEVVDPLDKATDAIQIMGETADGTVMSLIELEKHLKQQGGGGGPRTADISTWSMEDRARHNSALAAAGMLGRSGGDRGAGGVSVSMGDFAKSIGMSWAPNVGIGGMASTEQELDIARNIIKGGVESGATPEQIAAMINETMRRIAEGEGLVAQLGTGEGVAGTAVSLSEADAAALGAFIRDMESGAFAGTSPITINIDGIVTDPVATGEQIIKALNSALLVNGESLVTDAVIT